MGINCVSGKVSSGKGHEEVKFLVDSGASYTVLPQSVCKVLKLEPKRIAKSALVDGTTIERQIGECHIVLEQGDCHTPVVLGKLGDEPLLGAVTLEELGLELNPFNRSLHPMRMLMVCLLALCGMFSMAAAQDMPLSQVLIDGEGWQLLSEGHGFTEGPACDKEGNVFFTDIPNNRIHKIDVFGKVSVFAENTAKTNGLMFGPDGRLYGCRNGEKKIVAYDPDGKLHTIAEDIESNDLVVGSDGKIFVTDPSNQRVWLVSLNGEKRIVASGFRPNGVILWADEGTLVVTDSDKPHLWAFRVEKDGSLTCREKYYHPLVIPTGRDKPGSDGMTIDKDGRLYVTTAAGLHMFDPTGRLGGVIHKPQVKSLSNVCFGGTGFVFLYVTNGDKVYRRKTKTSGVLYGMKTK